MSVSFDTTSIGSHVGLRGWCEARSFHLPLSTISQVLESQLAMSTLCCMGGELELVLGLLIYSPNTTGTKTVSNHYFRISCISSFFFSEDTISRSAVWTHPGESSTKAILLARRTLPLSMAHQCSYHKLHGGFRTWKYSQSGRQGPCLQRHRIVQSMISCRTIATGIKSSRMTVFNP